MKPGEEMKIAAHIKVYKMHNDIVVMMDGQIRKRFKHDELIEAIRYAGWLGNIKKNGPIEKVKKE